MAEMVVHVTTLEQWKSVLDVWFEKGYEWGSGHKNKYFDEYFKTEGDRYLFILDGDIQAANSKSDNKTIEYKEFMSQQKEDNKMATVYEVSQSVFDTLQRIRANEDTSLIGSITWNAEFIKSIEVGNKAILRYLADDPAIEFKVKQQLYRLWRIDADGDKVYMTFTKYGTPDWTMDEDYAFTAPLEEIKRHKTVSWEIEEVK